MGFACSIIFPFISSSSFFYFSYLSLLLISCSSFNFLSISCNFCSTFSNLWFYFFLRSTLFTCCYLFSSITKMVSQWYIFYHLAYFLNLWVLNDIPLSFVLYWIATYFYCCFCCSFHWCCLQSILLRCVYTDWIVELGVIVIVSPRVLLIRVKCLVDPWIVHLHIVVVVNTMGIIQIEVFGVEIEIKYFLTLV